MSANICKECHMKLANFYYYKQEIISKQEKLNKLLEVTKIMHHIEEIEEDLNDYEFEAKLEPQVQVDIKVEDIYDTFKIPEAFQTVDYEEDPSSELVI